MSSDLSSDWTYEDGIPPIRTLDFGFYAVPKKEDIDQYILSVDGELLTKHGHYAVPAYISSEGYVRAETPTGPVLSTFGDEYSSVDNWCTLAPYVDRIYWKIDEDGSFSAQGDRV